MIIDEKLTMAEAEDVAMAMLTSFKVTGLYLPTSPLHPLEGQYLFIYFYGERKTKRASMIWSESVSDAEFRLSTLASDGVLFTPSP